MNAYYKNKPIPYRYNSLKQETDTVIAIAQDFHAHEHITTINSQQNPQPRYFDTVIFWICFMKLRIVNNHELPETDATTQQI